MAGRLAVERPRVEQRIRPVGLQEQAALYANARLAEFPLRKLGLCDVKEPHRIERIGISRLLIITRGLDVVSLSKGIVSRANQFLHVGVAVELVARLRLHFW